MTDWGAIFDLFSSEYGWTTEETMSLTTREVAWRMEAINNRKSSDTQLQATLHGMKFKAPLKKAVVKKLEAEKQNKLDAFINARLKGNSNGR